MWWGEGGGHHLQALAAGGQEAGHGHAGSQGVSVETVLDRQIMHVAQQLAMSYV